MMRVALPYYGRLIDPRQGLSQLYFIADVDLTTRAIMDMQLESYPRNSVQTFSSWLSSQMVSGVLSTDPPGHWLAELEEAGLWHNQVTGQEPDDQIRAWLKTSNSDADSNDACTSASTMQG
jgi:hypothetical protein